MEKKYEEVLSEILKMQQDGEDFPCPRCGHEMAVPLVRNALSRHAMVYVCATCGMDEALRDLTGEVLPIKEWAFTGILDDEVEDKFEQDNDVDSSCLDDTQQLGVINAALYDRMFREQKAYTKQLMEERPEKILESAYEFVIREDILQAVENNDLSLE